LALGHLFDTYSSIIWPNQKIKNHDHQRWIHVDCRLYCTRCVEYTRRMRSLLEPPLGS
jgi:hypothetical protein